MRISYWSSHVGSSDLLVVDSLPPEIQALPDGRLNLVLNDIRNIAQGNIAGRPDDPAIGQAAAYYRSLHAGGLAVMMAAVLSLAVGGLVFGRRFVSPTLRARNAVERAAMAFLILASTVARSDEHTSELQSLM